MSEQEVRKMFPFGAWRRRSGTHFRAVAMDAIEGPKVNARGDCYDTYVPLHELVRVFRDTEEGSG